MLKHNITKERKERHKHTQEDFTPKSVIDIMLNNMDDETLFSDFNKTFCDPCIGVGYIYIEVLKRRLKYCKNESDIISAVSTMYGVELMGDNVIECKHNILQAIVNEYNVCDDTIKQISEILNINIVNSDFFDWDFEKWTKK